MTTAVDLLDQDGVIISTAAVDDTFWAANAVQATAYAVQHGLGIFVPGGPPEAGTAELNINNMGGFQSWIASAGAGLVTPKSNAGSDAGSTAILSGALIGTAIVVTVVGWLTQRALDRAFRKKKK